MNYELLETKRGLYLIVGLVSVLHAKVVVLTVQVKVGKDQFILRTTLRYTFRNRIYVSGMVIGCNALKKLIRCMFFYCTLIIFQMMRVISSPSSSTTGLATAILGLLLTER